jgi:hypothetical protein
MLAVISRAARALTASGALVALASSASAQYFYDPCNICAPAVVMQPVTETVYREVPVTKYRTEARVVQKPVVRTEYQDRPVTAYRPVTIQQTAEVPAVTYQQVTECRPVTANNSYWRTAWQPVPKMHPLQYDPSPTLLGEMNRWSYATRMAFTPNYIPRREFVPNVVAYNVPVTRTVAVPTTRQVTYNVTRMEPYETTQRVAVQKIEYVDQTVTAMVPYTEMTTMAVGTTTRYAFVDPSGTTATARGPVPDRTAEEERIPRRAAGGDSGSSSSRDTEARPLSYPKEKAAPTPAEPGHRDARNQTEDDATTVAQAESRPVPSVVRVAGWRAHKPQTESLPTGNGPELSVAAK